MKKDKCGVILMQFRRERPARWAVHVARALLETYPQRRPGRARRWTLQVAVDCYDDLIKPVVVTSDDGFFQRLCFAFALRYPHVPFGMETVYEDDERTYLESTAAQYHDGAVRLTQYVRYRGGQSGESYASKWADWIVESGAFRLMDHGERQGSP